MGILPMSITGILPVSFVFLAKHRPERAAEVAGDPRRQRRADRASNARNADHQSVFHANSFW
jgi:hypothetical protein